MRQGFRATAAVLWSMLLVASASAQSPATRPVTFDDLMELRNVGSPALSPDGSQVVYVQSGWEHQNAKSDSVRGDRHDLRSHLWLVPASGGSPRQLTFGERGESSPAWSPDGRYISFLAVRGTGSEATAQVWLLPVAGGEARQLTHAKEGVRSYVWSPTGDRIAYLTTDSLSTAEAARRRRQDDALNYERDFRQVHIWVQDTTAQPAREVAHGDFTVHGQPSWSPDGEALVFAASTTPHIRDLGGAIYRVSLADCTPRVITPAAHSPHTQLGQPAWSPDGRTIAFVTVPQIAQLRPDSMLEAELYYTRLSLYDVSSGAIRVAYDSTLVVEVEGFTWTRDSRRLLFTAGEGAYQSVWEYDVAAQRFRRIAGELLLGSWSFSRAGDRVAYTMGSSAAPADLYVGDARFSRRTRLTDVNPQLRNLALGETQIVKWQSTDGTPVEGVLLLPVGYRSDERYPLLVEVHGGPTGVSTAGFKSPGQYWAGRGWAVFYPNPRGSTNYGERFMRANIDGWGEGDYRDIMSGVDELIRRGIADSTRLAIMGWSYGGYMTAWVVTQTNRFKAARMGAGMSNIASMYGTTDIPGYVGLFFGGRPSSRTLEAYRSRSPVTFAERVSTPLLILHGAADDRVPPGQALEFYRALRDYGKTVELVLYPREGHGLREYYHQLDRMQREYEWIARHTLE